MAILIDSALVDEVKQAGQLGFVHGVTTNPGLLAKVKDAPAEVIRQLCLVASGPVFYQLTAAAPAEREREALEFFGIACDRIVLKVPATTANMALIARLQARGVPCAATAVFAAYQAVAAAEAGARYVIPYVSRVSRLGGDGLGLVRELREAVGATGRQVRILAASIKSPEEAVAALVAGADDLTLPLEVLTALGNHRRSEEAIAEFDAVRRR
uniref:Transaldolase n=1 Tax=candidate division WOR-3 bacterium TaxID=2052148 RepID=A0A7C4CA00_UNCW3